MSRLVGQFDIVCIDGIEVDIGLVELNCAAETYTFHELRKGYVLTYNTIKVINIIGVLKLLMLWSLQDVLAVVELLLAGLLVAFASLGVVFAAVLGAVLVEQIESLFLDRLYHEIDCLLLVCAFKMQVLNLLFLNQNSVGKIAYQTCLLVGYGLQVVVVLPLLRMKVAEEEAKACIFCLCLFR